MAEQLTFKKFSLSAAQLTAIKGLFFLSLEKCIALAINFLACSAFTRNQIPMRYWEPLLLQYLKFPASFLI